MQWSKILYYKIFDTCLFINIDGDENTTTTTKKVHCGLGPFCLKVYLKRFHPNGIICDLEKK